MMRPIRNGLFFTLLTLISHQLFAQDSIVKTGDLWYYNDKNVDLGIFWYEYNYPFGSWEKGPSPLGYNYEGIQDTLPQLSADGEIKPPVTFFRKNVRIENLRDYLGFKLTYVRDDGMVLYINNQEVIRSNMPKGEVNYQTSAFSIIRKEEEGKVILEYLMPDLFQEGPNSIAASIHQVDGGSSDIIFNLELIGIKDPDLLNDFLSLDDGKVTNSDILLVDKTHQFNEEKIKSEFNQNMVKLQWIVIIFCIALFTILSYLFYRSHNKQSNSLLDLQRNLSAKDQKIKDKDGVIINHSLENIRDKSFFAEIKTDLNQLAKSDIEPRVVKSSISKMIKKIEAQSNMEEEWQSLRLHLDSVHSGFYSSLSDKYPNLTPLELRHCCFIKLHLDTKEISQILRIDPKSVQAARYRIKKKLNLGEDQNIKSVLAAI